VEGWLTCNSREITVAWHHAHAVSMTNSSCPSGRPQQRFRDKGENMATNAGRDGESAFLRRYLASSCESQRRWAHQSRNRGGHRSSAIWVVRVWNEPGLRAIVGNLQPQCPVPDISSGTLRVLSRSRIVRKSRLRAVITRDKRVKGPASDRALHGTSTAPLSAIITPRTLWRPEKKKKKREKFQEPRPLELRPSGGRFLGSSPTST